MDGDWLNDLAIGAAIRRVKADGTIERIDPNDFYAAPPEDSMTDKEIVDALGDLYEYARRHDPPAPRLYAIAAARIQTQAATIEALRAELATADRLLRASVPERFKGASSPVGAVQGYIADLEVALAGRNAVIDRALSGNAFADGGEFVAIPKAAYDEMRAIASGAYRETPA